LVVHFSPRYGKELTLKLTREALRLAALPGGTDAWDFRGRLTLDDHLDPLVVKLGRERPEGERAPPWGPWLHPIDDVRAHFARDHEALGLFASMLRRAAGEPPAEPLLEGRAHDRALGRLRSYLGGWQERKAGALSNPPGAESGGRLETRVLQGALVTLEREDARRVRGLSEEHLGLELQQQGWSPGEIRAVVKGALATGSAASRPWAA